jgi:hypothetical protein
MATEIRQRPEIAEKEVEITLEEKNRSQLTRRKLEQNLNKA